MTTPAPSAATHSPQSGQPNTVPLFGRCATTSALGRTTLSGVSIMTPLSRLSRTCRPGGAGLVRRSSGPGRAGVGPVLSGLGLALIALVAASCGDGDFTDESVGTTLAPTTVEIAGSTELLQAPTAVPTQPPVATSTPLPTATALPRTTEVQYTIVSGDVLGIIAERYDVSLSGLLDANPGVSANSLQVGQEITIPPPTGAVSGDPSLAVPVNTPEPRPTATPVVRLQRTDGVANQYIVVSGDRASNIAIAHGVSVDAIAGANGLVNVDSLWIGQCLIIPPVGSTSSGRISPTDALCPNGTASNGTAATATPTPTVDPNATATPSPTATPTPDPNGTATPTPTVDPSVTTTATPTPDPNATATPTPTVTVTATPTVDPAATATATPTPDPDFEEYGSNWVEWDGVQDSTAFTIQCTTDGGTITGAIGNICDLPG